MDYIPNTEPTPVVIIADPLLTAEEVMAALKVSAAMAYKIMAQAGAVRLGRAVRVRRSALEAFVDGVTQPPTG